MWVPGFCCEIKALNEEGRHGLSTAEGALWDKDGLGEETVVFPWPGFTVIDGRIYREAEGCPVFCEGAVEEPMVTGEVSLGWSLSREKGLSFPQASFPGNAQTVEARAQSHLSAMQAPSYGTGAPHQWMQNWPGWEMSLPPHPLTLARLPHRCDRLPMRTTRG